VANSTIRKLGYVRLNQDRRRDQIDDSIWLLVKMFVLAPGARFGREEYVQPSVPLVRIPGQSSKVTARAARLDPAITRVAV